MKTSFKTASCIFLIVAFFLLANPAVAKNLYYGKPESVGMSSDRLARIKPALQQYVDNKELVGAVSMIARNGKVIHFEKVGDLNMETAEDVQLDSIFRIYSMTKPIATTAAMILYEEGKFQLTDPVEKYLPEFKGVQVLENGKLVNQNKPFTIQNLMTHTAGLTYGFFGNTEVDKKYREAKILGEKNLAEFVADLGKLPLQYQPGTQWHYSVGIDVLGRLVEVVSGQPFDVFLKERIFDPLEMKDTSFQVPKEKLSRFGTNHRYSTESKSLVVIDKPETSNYVKEVTFFSGGGGLLSTASDYMRFCQMMLNGGELAGKRILGRKTVEFMTTNHLRGLTVNTSGEGRLNRPGFGFGLGFGIVADAPATGTISSEGEYYWGGAAGTIFWIDPEEDLIAIVMIQHMNVRIPLRQVFKALTYSAITM